MKKTISVAIVGLFLTIILSHGLFCELYYLLGFSKEYAFQNAGFMAEVFFGVTFFATIATAIFESCPKFPDE